MNTAYKTKCRERISGLATTMGLHIISIKDGSLNGELSLCVMFEPQTDIDGIVAAAQKCFRAAKVVKGKGAFRQYAPEIIYPTLYLVFTGKKSKEGVSNGHA